MVCMCFKAFRFNAMRVKHVTGLACPQTYLIPSQCSRSRKNPNGVRLTAQLNEFCRTEKNNQCHLDVKYFFGEKMKILLCLIAKYL